MPGQYDSEAEALAAKAEIAGIPAEVVEASKIPERKFDAHEKRRALEQLGKVGSDPEGEPVHHTELEAKEGHEHFTPAKALDPDYDWFVLGLAYALIPGLDRSLFQVYHQAGGHEAKFTKTHRSESGAILTVDGAQFDRNPWSVIIQGIPKGNAESFKKFIASYRFKVGDNVSPEVHVAGEQHWLVDWLTLRIADPLRSPGRYGVEVTFALPVNETTGRGVALATPPGLLLMPPTFRVTDLRR